jgi:hypothetical protein
VTIKKARRKASGRYRRSKWLGTTGLLIGFAVAGHLGTSLHRWVDLIACFGGS